ncbi:hypothetical protein [Cellvibrio sp. QJXJ]|uniref:hypothetical protein n=1 Tax=Cellvibrio sp. QJXJ TaxID=2964606 RepID=UPI0021C4251A|nr:hypothetical protein [Cellvibrio sp. QJXJ]UUA75230.1 hypothetical protein NNX04_22490 [Cellvibrio sp. QJXJ]
MSEVMLHAVLKMPPELWGNDALDQAQRAARYVEASNLITHLQNIIDIQASTIDDLRNRLRAMHISKSCSTHSQAEKLESQLTMYKNALELIATDKADWDKATAEMERDGLKLIAQAALNI